MTSSAPAHEDSSVTSDTSDVDRPAERLLDLGSELVRSSQWSSVTANCVFSSRP